MATSEDKETSRTSIFSWEYENKSQIRGITS